jgi:hypothetical protein
MSRDARGERGNAIVTAVLVIMIMTSLGLAAAAVVDTQSGHSRTQRERESSFNLAEAALAAQIFILGRLGTGTASNPHPVACPGASTFCPDDGRLMRNYNGARQVDFTEDASWTTQVRDDADAAKQPVRFWSDSILSDASWPRIDNDGNRHVWVRAEASVRGEKRALVAWVRIEDRVVSFPRYAVLAGYVRGKNSGGHGGRPLVNSTGSLGLAVRCNQPPKSSCIDLDPDKGPQLQPPGNYILSYQRPTAIGADDVQALEDQARAAGTYYPSCPSDPNGTVVVIENAGSCQYTNSAPAAPGASKCCNSSTKPGLLIVKRGSLNFGGNIEFWGVIYHLNLDNSTGERLIETSGTSAVRGGVLVDGGGGVFAGSSGDNIVYNAFAFDNIKAVGTAGVVQNTWREILPPD